MINESDLKRLLTKNLTQKDKLLIILATSESPLEVKIIREKAVQAGFRIIEKWNVSQILKSATGLAVRLSDGWEIQPEGLTHLQSLDLELSSPVIAQTATELRRHLEAISNNQTRSFLEEAVTCYEAKLFRAAVVLSWVGAVAVLQDYVLTSHLKDFNKAGLKRFKDKFVRVNKIEQFGRLQESDFLLLLDDIGVIHKSVRLQLEQRLDLRNGCGHPNPLSIGEHAVANHIEILIKNVFEKF